MIKFIKYFKKMSFSSFVQNILGNKIHFGSHKKPVKNEIDKCCLLEAISVYKGGNKNDDPNDLKFPDFRNLNDMEDGYDSRKRAICLSSLYDYYMDYENFSVNKKLKICIFLMNTIGFLKCYNYKTVSIENCPKCFNLEFDPEKKYFSIDMKKATKNKYDYKYNSFEYFSIIIYDLISKKYSMAKIRNILISSVKNVERHLATQK